MRRSIVGRALPTLWSVLMLLGLVAAERAAAQPAAPAAPADYYDRVDYGWIPKPRNAEESHALGEQLRIPPLLQEACRERAAGGGEDSMMNLVAKASLLRMIERPTGLIALHRAFFGTPKIADPTGRYRHCLDKRAEGWDTGNPNTTIGWAMVIRLVKLVPELTGRPGTSNVPTCRNATEFKEWDVTMALTFRVWGLLREQDKQALRHDIAMRAWLQGSPVDVEHTVCSNLPNPFFPHIPPVIDVPETENHTWLLRTTKFLHNEHLPMVLTNIYPWRGMEVDNYSRDRVANNETNGMTAWLKARLQVILDTDWKEYNSRPYSRWQMVGLLNLFDFAEDDSVKELARRALEFQAIKHVSQSADNLRTAPFRRSKENDNRVLFQGRTTAPMFQVWMGGLAQPVFPRAYEEPGTNKAGVQSEMALAASSDYRPSTWLADLAFNRDKRDFVQFFSGWRQGEAGYSGPDFTISGGGSRTKCPYPFDAPFPHSEYCYGDNNDPGTTEPVVVMPRLERTDGDDTTAHPEVDRFVHIDPTGQQNCLARNFACGSSVIIPDGLVHRADCTVQGTVIEPPPPEAAVDDPEPPPPPQRPHALYDKVLRFDEACAGPAYRGHCFYLYSATAGFRFNTRMNYLVTHSCDPNAGDAAIGASFQAFVTYMRTTGIPVGHAGYCTTDPPRYTSLTMTVTVPPTSGDLTNVTTGHPTTATHDNCDLANWYHSYGPSETGMFGDLGLDGTERYPVSTTTLAASAGQSAYQQPVTFTATVSTNPARVAGGTMRFLDGATLIGTAPLVDAGNGRATATLTTSALGVGEHRIAASYAGDAVVLASIGELTHTVTRAPTALTYTGATTGDYHDPATVAARLTNAVTATPVAGAPVVFTLNGQETCTGQTTVDGVASCVLTPNEPAGTYPIVADYAGDANFEPTIVRRDFVVTKEQTTLAYTGDTHIANGTPARLAAVLKEEGVVPIEGRDVTLALGAGATRQQCTGRTDATGTARCEVVATDQPLTDEASVPVAAAFAGDPYYLPSNAAATLKLQYATGQAAGVSARVRLPLISVGLPPTPDTGPVRTAGAVSTTTPCTATVSAVVHTAHSVCANVTTALNPGTSTATATVADVTIGLPGFPVVEVSGVRATSRTTCAEATGSVELALKVAGAPVSVSLAPNSVLDLGQGLRLVVNEQSPVAGADRGLTVNAVHLTAAAGAVDIVVGSSTSAMHNCKPQ